MGDGLGEIVQNNRSRWRRRNARHQQVGVYLGLLNDYDALMGSKDLHQREDRGSGVSLAEGTKS